jgi:hypothetical protein
MLATYENPIVRTDQSEIRLLLTVRQLRFTARMLVQRKLQGKCSNGCFLVLFWLYLQPKEKNYGTDSIYGPYGFGYKEEV